MLNRRVHVEPARNPRRLPILRFTTGDEQCAIALEIATHWQPRSFLPKKFRPIRDFLYHRASRAQRIRIYSQTQEVATTKRGAASLFETLMLEGTDGPKGLWSELEQLRQQIIDRST